MLPRMSTPEVELFSAFARCATHYFEFGAGGSTVLASRLVKGSVTAIDSAQVWLDSVLAACASDPTSLSPRLEHVDIGETAEWGYPANCDAQGRWPDYYQKFRASEFFTKADLYLVDGRFRVASFATVVLYGNPDAVILIHDYSSRPEYHVVETIAQKVATAEDLSAFVRARGSVLDEAEFLLQKYREQPN